MKNICIREIEADDIPGINKIYNDAISLGYATAHINALAISDHEEWYVRHKEQRNPILVAVDGNRVVAWNALRYYREGRQGLIKVRETSYYVDQNYWNRGIATLLMHAVIDKAIVMEIGSLVTFIMDINKTSIQLMKKFEFELWGRLPKIIQMDKGAYDHLIFGKNLEIQRLP